MITECHTDKLPSVLAHEVAHQQSFDLPWNLVMRILQMLLWFHPLAWRLVTMHNRACEEACDAVAAAYVGNTEDYSSILAQIALLIHSKVSLAGTIPMAHSSEIVTRLTALKRRLYPQRLRKHWFLLGGLLTLSALGLVGGTHFSYAQSATGRILNFPADRSLGRIMIQDVNLASIGILPV